MARFHRTKETAGELSETDSFDLRILRGHKLGVARWGRTAPETSGDTEPTRDQRRVDRSALPCAEPDQGPGPVLSD
eukprot:52426-Prymnesium_polylepis.2